MTTALLKPGTFIVFEGKYGSGKTTVIDNLQKRLGSFARTSLPSTETMTGFFVDEFLKSSYGNVPEGQAPFHIDKLTKLFLLLASDNDHYGTGVKPKLEEGHAVVQERHWWTRYATLFSDQLEYTMNENNFLDLCGLSMNELVPDLVFLFMNGPNTLNDYGIRKGYKRLSQTADPRVIQIPLEYEKYPINIVDFILSKLRQHQLLYNEES